MIIVTEERTTKAFFSSNLILHSSARSRGRPGASIFCINHTYDLMILKIREFRTPEAISPILIELESGTSITKSLRKPGPEFRIFEESNQSSLFIF